MVMGQWKSEQTNLQCLALRGNEKRLRLVMIRAEAGCVERSEKDWK